MSSSNTDVIATLMASASVRKRLSHAQLKLLRRLPPATDKSAAGSSNAQNVSPMPGPIRAPEAALV